MKIDIPLSREALSFISFIKLENHLADTWNLKGVWGFFGRREDAVASSTILVNQTCHGVTKCGGDKYFTRQMPAWLLLYSFLVKGPLCLLLLCRVVFRGRCDISELTAKIGTRLDFCFFPQRGIPGEVLLSSKNTGRQKQCVMHAHYEQIASLCCQLFVKKKWVTP